MPMVTLNGVVEVFVKMGLVLKEDIQVQQHLKNILMVFGMNTLDKTVLMAEDLTILMMSLVGTVILMPIH